MNQWKFTQNRLYPKYIVFLVVLFVTSFTLSAIIPPFQSPDEFDHIKRAYLLTKGQLVLDAPVGQNSGGLIDTGLTTYMGHYANMYGRPARKLTAPEQYSATNTWWSGIREFSPAPSTSYYFPLVYLPQALGLFVGESLDLSIDTSYRLARFLALLCASALLIVAFSLYSPAPIVLALLALPMYLFQIASASLDGVATALSVLAISVFLRLSVDRESSSRSLLYVLSVSVTLVTMSRFYLLPIVLLIFWTFIYTKDRRSLVAGAISTVAFIVWALIASNTTVDTRIITNLPPSGIAIFYLTNPAALFKVLFATITESNYLKSYLESFVGILGWLDARFPDSVYTYFFVAVPLIAMLSILNTGVRSDWSSSIVLILAALASIVLMFLAMLVTWNPHPTRMIEGVQGRYFIIPALLVAYGIANGDVRWSRLAVVVAMGLVGIQLLFSMFATTTLLIDRYYSWTTNPYVKPYGMIPSTPLSNTTPIRLAFDEDRRKSPAAIISIEVLIGTHSQTNEGLAELRLTALDGSRFVSSLRLNELQNNRYALIHLDGRAYVAGEIVSLNGGGISVWESHRANGGVATCIIFRTLSGKTHFTQGCPRS